MSEMKIRQLLFAAPCPFTLEEAAEVCRQNDCYNRIDLLEVLADLCECGILSYKNGVFDSVAIR